MEVLLVGVFGTAALYKIFGENTNVRSNMGVLNGNTNGESVQPPANPSGNGVIDSAEKLNLDNEYASVQGIQGRQPFQSCVDQQGAWISSSLLPKNGDGATNGEWNVSTPGSLENKNFLEAGHHFGVDTVGSSHKNANLQLRSEPIIPRKTDVSPFLNSSIMPEDHRRRFEIQDF